MQNRRLVFCLTAAVFVIALSGVASARSRYVAVPALHGKRMPLEIRFVQYTGGSTGKIVVDVRNTGKHAATFDAAGLYFVPQGDPERAPQRLGAAGPFEQEQQGSWERREKARIKPGQTVRLKLQVFCLDSHRSSPGTSQGFSVARKRLPRDLRKTIHSGAQGILKGAADVPSANNEIQSHVWKTRNKKWIKLQGERKSEKSSGGTSQRYRPRRAPDRIRLQQSVQP
jgi:hypothetical protein